jgi:hypothetical protein
MFEVFLEQSGEKAACRMAVDLLALAHDRGCEAELAEQIEEDLRQNRLPDMAVLRALFAPSDKALPQVEVTMADLSSYDQLVSSAAPSKEVPA